MSSKETRSWFLRVTSRYRVSSRPSSSPSSSRIWPVLSFTLRIALASRLASRERGHCLVLGAMDLDDLVDPRHGDHGLHARLQARQPKTPVLVLHQAVDVHQASDRGAVDVGDGRQ